MSPNTCPNCGHSDRHVRLVGCLHQDGHNYCTCPDHWVSKADQKADDQAATEAAIQTVQDNSDAEWVAAAEDAVKALAAEDELFTTDDVWDHLRNTGAPDPHDPRALGPVMRRAAREGLIRKVGFTASRRRHGAPLNTYRGEAHQ